MELKSWLSEFISTHDKHHRALMEYTEAMQAYRGGFPHENWERLQETLRRLKRQSDIIELNWIWL